MNIFVVNSLLLSLAACFFLQTSQPVFASTDDEAATLTPTTGAIIVHPHAEELIARQAEIDGFFRSQVRGPDSYEYRTLVMPVLRRAYEAIPPLIRAYGSKPIDPTSVLPAEVIIMNIFDHLDAPTLCTASAVSRGWQRLTTDNYDRLISSSYNPPEEVLHSKSYLALIISIRRQVMTIVGGGELDEELILPYVDRAFANCDINLYAQGLFCEARGEAAEAFSLYQHSSVLPAQNRLYPTDDEVPETDRNQEKGLYYKYFHLDPRIIPDKTRLAWFKNRAKAGDAEAQKYLTRAMYSGELGIKNTLSQQVRFAYLCLRANSYNDIEAKKIARLLYLSG